MPELYAAIVGSGPAGFYAAGGLLALEDVDVHVDMLERLPTPWGLVRSGVAPDHPKIKSVASVFAKTAEHERFRFFGNVELGAHVAREELLGHYDVVVYAVGTESEKTLDVPGEELAGSIGAIDVVGWYNGHPDYRDVHLDLSTERAVVIGNGNVALDVARILMSPISELEQTDIADDALADLRESRIREVVLAGRRGPLQASFTTVELRELGPMLPGVEINIDPGDLEPITDEEAQAGGTIVKRNIAAFRELAASEEPGAEHAVTLKFQRSPIAYRGDGRVQEVVLGRNELVADDTGRVSAKDTGERETLAAGLVVRAVGYRGVPLPGLPFDERRGVVRNEAGRVDGGDREYVVGWIKRGPTGVIGTNKKDATETVRTLAGDLDLAALPEADPGRGLRIAEWLESKQPRLVLAAGWKAIDEHERALGGPAGRPRVKLCTTDELLGVAHGEIS
jgi:ferredoxin--NADP+ reductase